MPIKYSLMHPLSIFFHRKDVIEMELPNRKKILIPFNFSKQPESVGAGDISQYVFSNPEIIGFFQSINGQIIFLSRKGYLTEYYFNNGKYIFVRTIGKIDLPKFKLKVVGAMYSNKSLKYIYADVASKVALVNNSYIGWRDDMIYYQITNFGKIANSAIQNEGTPVFEIGGKIIC